MLHMYRGFLGGASGKEPPAKAANGRYVGSIPGWGGAPGGEHGIPLHIPAWRIPWTEEPGGLWVIGSQGESDTTEAT